MGHSVLPVPLPNLFLCLIPTLTGDTLRAGVSQLWVFNI